MPVSQTEGYFENPCNCFLEESMLFLLELKWKLQKKVFSNVKTKPNQIFPWKLLKEASTHFYCQFDELRFSGICTIMELKELWLCKHMKNVRSSQP